MPPLRWRGWASKGDRTNNTVGQCRQRPATQRVTYTQEQSNVWQEKQVARNALGAALIFAFTATPVAFAADEKGWYMGASLGQSRVRY